MTATAEKLYPIRFIVEGAGAFPLDMLRYDSCWPSTQDDVAEMGNDRSPVQRIRRQVTLSGFSRVKPPANLSVWSFDAYAKDGFTRARWESFGWSVVAVEARS